MRHVPAWFDRFPGSRRPSYPRLQGQHDTGVVVLGGGLTAASCAHVLAGAGIPAVVLAAGKVGAGQTGGSAGLIREGFAGSFHDAAKLYGLRRGRALWEGVRRGGLEFAAAVRRHGIRCDLTPRDLLTISGRAPEDPSALKREYDTRHDAGVAGTWLTPASLRRETCLETNGAIRTHGFTIDPYRACIGLLRHAEARGVMIHEGSPAMRIRPSKGSVTISTPRGTVRGEWVIVTTATTVQDLRPLRRHLRPEQEYGVLTEQVPAPIRRGMGTREAVLETYGADHHYLRWMPDDSVLIVGGRGPVVAERARQRALIQRTGQLMYEFLLLYPDIAGLRPSAAWDCVDDETVDGFPFIGPHRRFPRHFFAFGSTRHGEGAAWLAARMALRHIQGAPSKEDEVFGFPRIL